MMAAPNTLDDDWAVSPPERLDEAFALMRALPVTAVCWCVVGPAPMVLGLLFFWSELTRGGASALGAAGWAVGLGILYGWLKITQAFFARAVWARLLPEGGLPEMTWGSWYRRTGALLVLGAVSLPLQVVAAPLVLPFAWVFGFFHHATALAYTHDLGPRPLRRLIRESAGLAHLEPLGHHFMLLLLAVLGVLVWGAVYALGLLLPYLMKILTGVESEFTRNPLAVALNTLYVSVTVSVAWMMVSPYFRVAYVLRTFHAVSRRTGDDLLGRLHAARRRAAAAVAAGLMVLLGVSGAVGAAEPVTGEASGTPPAVETRVPLDPAPLAEAIQTTLAGRDYQWRVPRAAAAGVEKPENALVAFLKRMLNGARDALRELDRLLTEVGRTLRKLLGGGAPPATTPTGAGGEFTGSALRGIVMVVGGVVVVAMVIVLWRWRRRRSPATSTVVAASLTSQVNLADEATLASALPEDEWLMLARAQWAGGDLRLAVRAAFLATLASLGEQRLIDIAKSKSNRDYGTELRLRAAARREVPAVFERSVGVFERAWYGLHEVAPGWVQELLDNHQRLSSRGPMA